MDTTGNTILVTGGGSGIGRALAEALHAQGNQVIVSGRRQAALDDVTTANPGMASLALDIADKASIEAFAEEIVERFPALNAVLNNAGIMRLEDLGRAPASLADAEDTVLTNLLGPIRLTSLLLPHLRRQPKSTVLTVSSGLAFVPMAATPTYCATKAAIHSYSVTLRQQLKGTSVEVIEIAPPYVQTELMSPNQAHDPHAMPLADFTAEVMALLAEGTHEEIIVERCKPLRYAAENGTLQQQMDMFNSMKF